MTFDDEVPMGRDWASRLLEHINEQWGQPLTHEERQEWGTLLQELDCDYAVCAFSAMKVASPRSRPTTKNFIDCYQGIMEEAHRPSEPVHTIQGRMRDEGAIAEIWRIRDENGYDPSHDQLMATGS